MLCVPKGSVVVVNCTVSFGKPKVIVPTDPPSMERVTAPVGLDTMVVPGAVGATVVSAMNSLIQQHGGVQGVVAQLEQQGLGNTVKSWVGTGPNQPISPEQIHQVFGGAVTAIPPPPGAPAVNEATHLDPDLTWQSSIGQVIYLQSLLSDPS